MSISTPRAGSTTTGEPEQPTWGIPDALVGYVVAYVFASLVGALVMAAGGFSTKDEIEGAPLTWTMGAAVFIWIAFGAIAIWVAAHKGRGWRRDYHVSIRPVDVPLGIAAGVFAQFVLVNAIAWPLLKISGKNAEDLAKPAQDLADKAHGAGGAVLFILVVCVLAPVAEELFFRGLVYRAAEKRWNPWVALVFSSAFFALTHFQRLQFLPLMAAGAVFGYLVLRTGRLGPAVVAHMAFNFSTAVVLLWVN